MYTDTGSVSVVQYKKASCWAFLCPLLSISVVQKNRMYKFFITKGLDMDKITTDRSISLIEAWNSTFPDTTRGYPNTLYDQNAFVRLLTHFSETEEDIRKVIKFIAKEGKIRYIKRPARLIKREDQGQGMMVYYSLKMDMEDTMSQKRRDHKSAPSVPHQEPDRIRVNWG